MLNRVLLALALLSGTATSSLSAQASDTISVVVHLMPMPSSGRGASNTAPMTELEIQDACNHKPGARMRLYGCAARPGDELHEPSYIIDGVLMTRAIVGPAAERRDSRIAAALTAQGAAVTVLNQSNASVQYGIVAEYGIILIATVPQPTRIP
jgi:hypothetical protein